MGERLSAQYTWTEGHRGFDVLHVATALHFGARELLTFDAKQKRLAEAEGLVVRCDCDFPWDTMPHLVSGEAGLDSDAELCRPVLLRGS